ncbi:MAG TPA: hypothetical protein VHR86_04930 [Armatimonadota bacterium]|nr:hypothetical protein [Armatimonadota bacterium]
MNIKEHLRELRRRGALLRVDGNKLFLDATEDALTEEEWEHLAGHKGEIIALMTGPVRSVLAFPLPGSVPPLPAPAGIEYEPGADWQSGEEPTTDLMINTSGALQLTTRAEDMQDDAT